MQGSRSVTRVVDCLFDRGIAYVPYSKLLDNVGASERRSRLEGKHRVFAL